MPTKRPSFDVRDLPVEFFDSVTIYSLRRSIKMIEGMRKDWRKKVPLTPVAVRDIDQMTVDLRHLRKALGYYGG